MGKILEVDPESCVSFYQYLTLEVPVVLMGALAVTQLKSRVVKGACEDFLFRILESRFSFCLFYELNLVLQDSSVNLLSPRR